MKVNGYKLREAIKMIHTELGILNSQFSDTLFKFPEEVKPAPETVIEQITNLEEKLCLLQTAQGYYNLNVILNFNNKSLLLENAINLVGAKARKSNLWKTATGAEKTPSYFRGSHMTRKADDITAESTVDKVKALESYKQSEKESAGLKSAIAIANNTEVEINFIDEKLFS